MGLDMFLEGVNYIDSDHYDGEYRLTKVMEWRKAYAIMDWFTANLMEGYELHNCARYNLPKEDLEDLVQFCKDFIESPTGAISETNATWYVERYRDYDIEECRDTISIINQIIKEDKYEFYMFHAWW